MNIRLCKMTKTLNRIYFRKFEYDPDLFDDMSEFQPYSYDRAKCDAYWYRQQNLGRVHLAIVCGIVPIGEVILKNIDRTNRCCTLSIHLRNDSVKNRGYGTEAEIQALRFAFKKLQCSTVYADTILKNVRSQHVLEKVGFQETHRDDSFVYYRCECRAWSTVKHRETVRSG